MAVIQKTLFAKNLDKYAVLVNDTEPNSRYFKITELPDTFTGGKNAFLVAGSKELVADTKIQIELKDAAGNIIYHEPGEGYISSSLNGTPFVTEYYEGVSKVVSVYIYPDTSYGPCTLTILGELSEYTDTNGIVVPVGLDWENKYNVKWTKTINVNPALANTTKIRFYQRPQATITEILSPIYKIENDLKVASAVTQSFANIKLSKLETFAGDVKRVKVFRTSQGDISDFDLIQDILVESKELLTSYGLSGSVVGQTGILTSETLKNNWNTGSLNAHLTSSRVESGVRLTGSGYFTYTSSLDIKSTNTYELNLDAFYSSSTSSNLGVYLSWVSQSTTFSSSIATLVGTTPTKNLLDTVVPFKIDTDYPTASLYFSQSQGEWHLGNISLKLSQDTAFSPDEISFVTTMPTVLGNETFNFKFEFYDVNNNYVPVAVTQSATFNGGNTNIGGTILLISSSTSQSLADLNRVSSSISGTVTFNSSSISTSVGTLSGSVSSSLSSLSSSVSSSNVFILSSSLSKTQELANGQFSGSFIGSDVIYSPTIGGQQGYISKLFTVGDTSAARINLDARNIADGAGDNLRRIWIGTGAYGLYNNTNTAVYLDSAGKFSLKDKLTWDGSTLSITGNLNVGSSVPNSVVTGLKALALKDTVSSTEIDANAVTEGKIGTGAVSNAKIAADAVTEGKIATNAVTSGKIIANAIIAGKIATDAVTADTIAAGSITAGKIVAGAISADKIAAGAITADKIDALAITADKIAAGAITAGKIDAGAITTDKLAAGAVTAAKVDVAGVITAGSIVVTGNNVSTLTNNSGYQANGDAKTAGSVGGWSINGSQIFNTNVQIDNTNSRIDFLSGGIVKTRIKSGNVSIGDTATVAITIAAGSQTTDSFTGTTSPQYGPAQIQTANGGNTAEVYLTTPAGVNGNNLSLVIPYAGITSVGVVQCNSIGNGSSCQYGYDTKMYYTVRETNSVGTTVADGFVQLALQNYFTSYPSGFGTITLPGFLGGSITIPSIGTAVAGKVYWISVSMSTVVKTRINPNGITALGSGAGMFIIASGWDAVTSNAILLAVAARAEFGTNGVQIGSAEGSYVALGDAAGAGRVGLFAGNLSVIGTVAAGSVTASDKRAKTNIQTISNGIETIKKLNPVSYDWLQHITGNFEFQKGYGFIADEIQNIMPELIYEKQGYTYKDFKHLDYTSFHAIAIKAIQELVDKVEKLEAQISGSNDKIEEVI
jgi:hypothetical protein